MTKNSIQFQPGICLQKFISKYGSEEQGYQALFKWLWPNGFKCPECAHDRYCTLKSRKLLQCNRCRSQISITARIIFDSTKLPLKLRGFSVFTSLHSLKLVFQLSV